MIDEFLLSQFMSLLKRQLTTSRVCVSNLPHGATIPNRIVHHSMGCWAALGSSYLNETGERWQWQKRLNSNDSFSTVQLCYLTSDDGPTAIVPRMLIASSMSVYFMHSVFFTSSRVRKRAEHKRKKRARFETHPSIVPRCLPLSNTNANLLTRKIDFPSPAHVYFPISSFRMWCPMDILRI